MKNNEQWLMTSESVTEGHPDKLCDQISDAILDEILRSDPNARVACETAVTTGLVLVMGEITTSEYVDVPQIVRNTVREVGYTGACGGFDADACAVLTSIHEQSGDIALGVNDAMETRQHGLTGTDKVATGAGDQGLMFGYANSDTPEMMPLPISLAHQLSQQLAFVRKQGLSSVLFPDGKSQVTVRYEGDKPVHIDTVVVSTQHHLDATLVEIEEIVKNLVITPVLEKTGLFDQSTRILINPTGRFVIGGPQGDSGVTGRKIIVDTYGGFSRHGGGAFSGKDPTKVDRSASYGARYVAKNIVASGIAKACEIQLAYAIGVAEPVSIAVETFGTSELSSQALVQLVKDNFALSPDALIDQFDLRRPIYHQVASYGHFGRPDLDLPWERLDKVEALRQFVATN